MVPWKILKSLPEQGFSWILKSALNPFGGERHWFRHRMAPGAATPDRWQTLWVGCPWVHQVSESRLLGDFGKHAHG